MHPVSVAFFTSGHVQRRKRLRLGFKLMIHHFLYSIGLTGTFSCHPPSPRYSFQSVSLVASTRLSAHPYIYRTICSLIVHPQLRLLLFRRRWALGWKALQRDHHEGGISMVCYTRSPPQSPTHSVQVLAGNRCR